MTPPFTVRTAARYDRLAKALQRGHPEFHTYHDSALRILATDPYNRTRRYHIKKLEAVPPGEGQYRPSLGRWRGGRFAWRNRAAMCSHRDLFSAASETFLPAQIPCPAASAANASARPCCLTPAFLRRGVAASTPSRWAGTRGVLRSDADVTDTHRGGLSLGSFQSALTSAAESARIIGGSPKS
jgi:hypothetical protein